MKKNCLALHIPFAFNSYAQEEEAPTKKINISGPSDASILFNLYSFNLNYEELDTQTHARFFANDLGFAIGMSKVVMG
ncbi:hypothetical protein [Gillisia mitskevichiae]|uniref:hypothetical protein n=1 Tax=Gillisia mitskevichiae TaxID=270921 RepID=UPI000EACB130|nr:hypothetical protein [Gillisia mitskevichiae]